MKTPKDGQIFTPRTRHHSMVVCCKLCKGGVSYRQRSSLGSNAPSLCCPIHCNPHLLMLWSIGRYTLNRGRLFQLVRSHRYTFEHPHLVFYVNTQLLHHWVSTLVNYASDGLRYRSSSAYSCIFSGMKAPDTCSG